MFLYHATCFVRARLHLCYVVNEGWFWPGLIWPRVLMRRMYAYIFNICNSYHGIHIGEPMLRAQFCFVWLMVYAVEFIWKNPRHNTIFIMPWDLWKYPCHRVVYILFTLWLMPRNSSRNPCHSIVCVLLLYGLCYGIRMEEPIAYFAFFFLCFMAYATEFI